ncbi:lysophospholipase D GDPD1 [Pelobates cultripes]|uniref:Lysophospholipase D GDPD1 n=1 Tax=Pelobates cultripes TaxID=61616 RepID=A0AAD1VNG8_PELCU|nr:lysophospholipase D GDPD1 [Pelobates cultripes]
MLNYWGWHAAILGSGCWRTIEEPMRRSLREGKAVAVHLTPRLNRLHASVAAPELQDPQNLPSYLCQLDVTFEKDCCCEGGEDRRIPLLKEVFESFPETPINIDIKVNSNILVKKVSELIREYKREQLTVWGNADYEIVQKCQKENNDIPLLFCFQRVLLLVGLFYTGLLPFVPIREQFLEIPMPSIIMKLKDPSKMSRSHKFVVWLADALIMRKGLFDHLKARGIQVYIWVLNNEEEYKRAFDLGATGIMTDYPTRLKEYMETHSL